MSRFIRCASLLALLMVQNGCINGPDEHIIVPEGYRGFVGIFYERGTYPLPVQNDSVVFEFPADGVLLTSSRIDTRWKNLLFFERTETGLLPLRSNLPGPVPRDISPTERIFSGGTTHIHDQGPPIVIYFVGDSGDRSKLDWQSASQWIDGVLRSNR